jgi:putative PIN family toxin of toxin-antitoxin system
MRILIDANVYLSFLLNPRGHGAASRVVSLIGTESFELIFPLEIEQELRRNVASKRYLRERILEEQLDALIQVISDIAVPVDSGLPSPISSRDADDTRLLEIAFAGRADYLISGDQDILVLAPFIPQPRIVSPAEFVAEIESDEKR